jgi:hypothetical protein
MTFLWKRAELSGKALVLLSLTSLRVATARSWQVGAVFETPLLTPLSRRRSEKVRRGREQYWPTADYRIFVAYDDYLYETS